MKLTISPVALLLIASSCFSQVPLSEQEQVQAAAIRHALREFDPLLGNKPPRAFCVGVQAGQDDPSAAMLAALTDSRRDTDMLPLSQCRSACPEDSHEMFPRAALLQCGRVSTGDVVVDAEDHASVSLNLIAGPLWGHSGVYRLRRVAGRWEVAHFELRTVS